MTISTALTKKLQSWQKPFRAVALLRKDVTEMPLAFNNFRD